MLVSDEIDKQMKQYAVCNEDFNEIQHKMSIVEDRYCHVPDKNNTL